MCALFALTCFILAVSSWNTETSALQSIVLSSLCALVGIPTVWLMARVLRQGIFVDSSGLLVRNVFRVQRVAWSDVKGFEGPARYGRIKDAGIQIELNDGRTMYANLFSLGPFHRSSHFDNILRQLRELQAQHDQVRAPADVDWSRFPRFSDG
jgi:hypothetical protein